MVDEAVTLVLSVEATATDVFRVGATPALREAARFVGGTLVIDTDTGGAGS